MRFAWAPGRLKELRAFYVETFRSAKFGVAQQACRRKRRGFNSSWQSVRCCVATQSANKTSSPINCPKTESTGAVCPLSHLGVGQGRESCWPKPMVKENCASTWSAVSPPSGAEGRGGGAARVCGLPHATEDDAIWLPTPPLAKIPSVRPAVTRALARLPAPAASLDGCRSRGIKDIKSLPPRTAARKRVSGPMVNCI